MIKKSTRKTSERTRYTLSYWVLGGLIYNLVIPVSSAWAGSFNLSSNNLTLNDFYQEIGGQIYPLSSTVLRKSGERFFDLTYDRLGGQAGSILEGNQEARLSQSKANTLSYLEDSQNGASALKAYARDRYDAKVWISGYGLFGNIDSDRNAAGADYSIGGFATGFDKQVTREFKVGVAFGYAHTDADADRGLGELDADSYHFGIYGRYTPEDLLGEDGWFVDGLIGGGIHDVDTRRNISFGIIQQTARGDYTDESFLAGAQIGKEYQLSQHFRLVPSLGLHYQLINQDNFKEKGGDLQLGDIATLPGILRLSVERENDESLRLTPGFRFNIVDLEIAGLEISPSAYAGYQYEALDATKRINARLDRIPGSDDFTTQGPGLSRHTALLSVGVDAKADKNFDLFLRWDGTFSEAEDTNAVIGGVKYSW